MCDVQKVTDALCASKAFGEPFPEGALRDMFRDRFVATFPALLEDLLDEKATRITVLKARQRIWQRMLDEDLWCDFIRARAEAGQDTDGPLEPALSAAREGIAEQVVAIGSEVNMLILTASSPLSMATIATVNQQFYNHAVAAGADPKNITLRQLMETAPLVVVI